MTATLFIGPLITAGNDMDNIAGTPQKTAPDAGSNISYHGSALLDVRQSPINKEQIGVPGSIRSFFVTPELLSVNYVPSVIAAGNIAAAANVTTATPMTLAAASTGIATNIPILPVGNNTTVVTANIALDFGFDSANCTSGSTTVTVANSTLYVAGQPLVIANVGNAGGTSALLCFVKSIPTATTIVVSSAPQATNAATPIGNGLPGWGNLVNHPATTPLYADPSIVNGVGLDFDPTQGLARCVSITGASGGAGGTFTIAGWDIYSTPMTQTITVAAGVNTVNSTKAFKYIQSVTPNFTDAHNYSVQTADIFGFNFRSDMFEATRIFWNSAAITANTGYVAAVTTTPATATTGDVRGTYATQSASDGTKRLVMYQDPSLFNVKAIPVNPVPLFGVTQV